MAKRINGCEQTKNVFQSSLEVYKFINQLVTAAAYFAIMALPEFHNFSVSRNFPFALL